MDDGNESEENDVRWQVVPPYKLQKRRLNESPKMYKYKKPNINNLNNLLSTNNSTTLTNNYNNDKTTNKNNNNINYEASTSEQARIANKTTSNQFQLLDVDDDDEDDSISEKEKQKPPPLIIPDVENISMMTKSISKVIPSSEFSYKTMREGHVRLMVKTIDSYRKIVKYLDSKNISYHTYQLKQERAYRVVIKGVHHTTPVEDIKAELLLLGHQVRSIFNIKSKVSKRPLPMFFVDLDPNTNNKEIYNMKSINNAIVSVEPPKKQNDLVQCFRCQQFGHTKTYCKKPYKCVKCGDDHATAECKKDINTPPKCVHCSQNHTASYKGCRIYQEIVHKKQPTYARDRPRTLSFQTNPLDFPQSSSQYNNNTNPNETERMS